MTVQVGTCCKCLEPDKDLMPAPCRFDPRESDDHYCPECSGLVVPGKPHPMVCVDCCVSTLHYQVLTEDPE